MIHTVSLDDATAATLNAIAKDKRIDMFKLEGAILEHFAVQWESATAHERQKIMDSLRTTLGGE
jgi:hypothetical protein